MFLCFFLFLREAIIPNLLFVSCFHRSDPNYRECQKHLKGRKRAFPRKEVRSRLKFLLALWIQWPPPSQKRGNRFETLLEMVWIQVQVMHLLPHPQVVATTLRPTPPMSPRINQVGFCTWLNQCFCWLTRNFSLNSANASVLFQCFREMTELEELPTLSFYLCFPLCFSFFWGILHALVRILALRMLWHVLFSCSYNIITKLFPEKRKNYYQISLAWFAIFAVLPINLVAPEKTHDMIFFPPWVINSILRRGICSKIDHLFFFELIKIREKKRLGTGFTLRQIIIVMTTTVLQFYFEKYLLLFNFLS